MSFLFILVANVFFGIFMGVLGINVAKTPLLYCVLALPFAILSGLVGAALFRDKK